MLPEEEFNHRDYIHSPVHMRASFVATYKRSVITKASAVPAFDFRQKKPIKNIKNNELQCYWVGGAGTLYVKSMSAIAYKYFAGVG